MVAVALVPPATIPVVCPATFGTGGQGTNPVLRLSKAVHPAVAQGHQDPPLYQQDVIFGCCLMLIIPNNLMKPYPGERFWAPLRDNYFIAERVFRSKTTSVLFIGGLADILQIGWIIRSIRRWGCPLDRGLSKVGATEL